MGQRTSTERAVLSAAAVTACGAVGAASADVVRVDRELAEPISFTNLTVLVNPELHRPETCLISSDQGPGIGTEFADTTFTDVPDEFFFVGLSDSGNVVVSFADPTIAAGLTFEQLFVGFDQASLADDIANGRSYASYIDLLSGMSGVGAKMGDTATVIEFGAGSVLGTFAVSIVPAPGAAGVLVCAMVIRGSRRRDRQS